MLVVHTSYHYTTTVPVTVPATLHHHTHYVVDIHQPSILMYVLLAVLLVDTYLKVHTC